VAEGSEATQQHVAGMGRVHSLNASSAQAHAGREATGTKAKVGCRQGEMSESR
jgi:hypothetical protein